MNYPRLDRAIRAATKWHAGQDREGDSPLPYITHPMEVLILLRTVGKVLHEELLCAAILHDVLEETDATPEQIEEIAGARVRSLVQELTRVEPSAQETKGLSKEAIWKLRALRLLDEIRGQSRDAQQIKLADRLSNVREAKRTKPPEKRDRYLWQTFRILEIVPREVNPPLWDAIRAELPEAEVPEPYPHLASS
ncbi:HD domain-containing protein [Fimbriimonas ginsengisoli]|uniref:Metal dependent phosphohydrolase n=1 Tax=Fimbriimonas ginsengisoli Gsoil 348 TaxID=661478 RepID=A0A068NXZ9_FIMGI|nr:HD domain-containing protein [Fimbriimonas ginsengisoli]AIE87705.1 metal dependent phosphohydrolase [Fimbriimonas ginsengisoli Gsoil 348]